MARDGRHAPRSPSGPHIALKISLSNRLRSGFLEPDSEILAPSCSARAAAMAALTWNIVATMRAAITFELVSAGEDDVVTVH